jgi:hypothetical protein
MKEDQLKINKFKELLPDNQASNFFDSLSSSGIVRDGNLFSVRNYLEYIKDYKLNFEDEVLNKNHSELYSSLNKLSDFILCRFFYKETYDTILVLHPEMKNEDPKQFKEYENELTLLVEDAENKYKIFRKSIEEYILEDNNEINSVIRENKKDILITNKKRMSLPKFPRTEWAKVSIKFIDDTNILLSDSKETKPIIPESIGCIDGRTQKVDTNWEFLIEVAKGEGITNFITKTERERTKKQKQKITDILRKIFQNDTDPFETEKGGIYRAKFIIGYYKDEKIEPKTKKEFLDLEEARKEMTSE